MDLSVRIGAGTLPNPVGVASGTFGYGGEYESLLDLAGLGAIYTKAITEKPRGGNELPRLAETPAGLLNSIGLANVGVERFVADKLPFLRTLPCAVVANVAGSTEDEYERVLLALEAAGGLFGYEINVSCPNVKEGGMAFGTDAGLVERLTARLRKLTQRPLVVKLSPNVTDIAAMAKAAEQGGADAVSCINTVLGMAIDVESGRPVLPAGCGGLSGPAIRPVGVAATWRVAKAVRIPVIGLGGIVEPEDALQYLLAGASAVQVGTGTFLDPSCPARVLSGIRAWCGRKGVTSLAALPRPALGKG